MGNYTKPLLEYLESQLDQAERRQSIGEQIRAARISSGTTQRTLADSVGVSQAYLSNVEAGRKWPSPQMMTSIVYYFSKGEDHGPSEGQSTKEED